MISKRRRYGQHFLISDSVAEYILSMSGATKDHIVLEIGTGLGILTKKLCQSSGQVISAEYDAQLYNKAVLNLQNNENLTLLHGDGFKINSEFDIFASNLPYSVSRRAVEWLATKTFQRGVVMVQEEFARKIQTKTKKRAISVIWQEAFRVTRSFVVGPNNFEPPPRVKSVVLAFEKTCTISPRTIQNIHRLFSQRRKILRHDPTPKRLDDLSTRQVLEVAQTIQ